MDDLNTDKLAIRETVGNWTVWGLVTAGRRVAARWL
jgi:hypothetical protein